MTVVICMLLLVSGCGKVPQTQNVAQNNTPKTDQILSVESKDEDNSWKQPIAQKLLQEFNVYYKKLKNNENVPYNRIMAADRATGLLTVYKDYISSDELKKIRSKLNKINEDSWSAAVSFGYTSSGLHIISIMDMENNGTYNYERAYDSIRGCDSEDKLMEDMFNAGCTASDIYIEDLRGRRNSFTVYATPVFLDGTIFKIIPEEKDISESTNKVLNDYNRHIESKDGVYKNKEWRLFATASIYSFLSIYVDNEKIDLASDASDIQYYGE